MSAVPLLALPPEVLGNIFRNLEINDLQNAMRTCSFLRNAIVNDNSLWRAYSRKKLIISSPNHRYPPLFGIIHISNLIIYVMIVIIYLPPSNLLFEPAIISLSLSQPTYPIREKRGQSLGSNISFLAPGRLTKPLFSGNLRHSIGTTNVDFHIIGAMEFTETR